MMLFDKNDKLVHNTVGELMKLQKITVWTAVTDGGDGSAHNVWYLTKEDCQKHERIQEEEYDGGWGEECIESVETFVGSDIHMEAERNSAKLSEGE